MRRTPTDLGPGPYGEHRFTAHEPAGGRQLAGPRYLAREWRPGPAIRVLLYERSPGPGCLPHAGGKQRDDTTSVAVAVTNRP